MTHTTTAATQMWTEVLALSGIIQKTEVAVRELEKRHKREYKDLFTVAKRNHVHLMRVVLRTWFEAHYRCPSKINSQARTVRILRSILLNRVNEFLQQLGLPCLTKKHPLWLWFLSDILNLTEQECSSGKAIVLEELLSVEEFRDRLDQFYQNTITRIREKPNFSSGDTNSYCFHSNIGEHDEDSEEKDHNNNEEDPSLLPTAKVRRLSNPVN